MRCISIDIETYSDVDLSKCGVYRYSSSPNFEILLFGYSVDGGEVRVVDLCQGENIPDCIPDHFHIHPDAPVVDLLVLPVFLPHKIRDRGWLIYAREKTSLRISWRRSQMSLSPSGRSMPCSRGCAYQITLGNGWSRNRGNAPWSGLPRWLYLIMLLRQEILLVPDFIRKVILRTGPAAKRLPVTDLL